MSDEDVAFLAVRSIAMYLFDTIHWLDLTVLAVAILAAALGAWRGVLRQTDRLLLFVASFYAAFHLHAPVKAAVQPCLDKIGLEVPNLHSYLGTFMLVYLPLFRA